MKVYPARYIRQQAEAEDKKLTATARVTKMIALIIAFVTVYFFFFKILFF